MQPVIVGGGGELIYKYMIMGIYDVNTDGNVCKHLTAKGLR